jgi:two-component system chemotaxis sensor kinase CheA
MNNEEFLQEFIDEAKSHLEVIESGIIDLESESYDMELINKIFRAVHSIKGTAGFFELKNIVELSHCIENNFDEIRENKKQLSEKSIDILLKSFDALRDLVENVHTSDDADIGDLLLKLKEVFESEEQISTPKQTEKENEVEPFGKESIEVPDELRQENIEEASLNQIIQEEFSQDTEQSLHVGTHEDIKKDKLEPIENFSISQMMKQQQEKDQLDNSKEQNLEKDEKNAGVKKPGNNGDESIRVNVTLLNNILNLASELVLGRNQLLRVTDNYRKVVPNIDGVLQNIDHITTELQERVMQTRMQPLGTIFNKFPRVVRDLSKKLQKDVELKINGADVELDKSIIESLADPLTHILRNSLDHGIEGLQKRKEAGKDIKGKINLSAYHEGGYVIIDVVDDGAGINVAKIKKKVLELGIATHNELENMQENEIIQFLFHAGLSTAEKVTDVSGRGVGMDVVKNNIEKLGGNIEIQTVLGQGTTVRLLLPLTLAIISAIIVQVKDQKFALPQINLQEIVRIKRQENVRKIEYINKTEVLRLRGKLLPIIRLSDNLRMNMKENNSDDRGGSSQLNFLENLDDVTRILVIKIGSRRFGLAVDEIHGSEEILVKPLPSYVKDLRTYSGVTILGDGRVAMILDPDGIMNKANLNNFDENQNNEQTELEAKEFEKQNMLLFKCSGNELLAMDIAMVKRIEEIHTDDIEVISGKEFMKYLDHSIRVVRPENVIPNFSKKELQGKAYVIIPRMTDNPMGILISKVMDTVNLHVNFVNTETPPEGILGTILVNEKLISVMNMFYIFEKIIPDYTKVKLEVEVRKQKRILLAEDTPFFQRIVKEFLESAGFFVELAENGKMAYEIIEQGQFDIVVTDIQMPVMDGLEFAKKLRNSERYNKIPIIGLTSMTGERNKKIGMEAGFNAYQYKLQKNELLQAIESFFE